MIEIFAFWILTLIYINVRKRTEELVFEQKLYLLLIISNALILIFDTGMYLINGHSFFLGREINIFLSTCYYILNPIPCLLWSYYADYRVIRNPQRFKRLFLPLMIPTLIHSILALASINSDLLFYIDYSNTYHRGFLFPATVVTCYFYLCYTFVNIIRSRRVIRADEYYPMLSVAIPPFIGGIIQWLVYGLSLIWLAMSFSLLIIFVNVQSKEIYLDYLTGLFNRRQLDNYLSQRLKSRRNGKMLAGIMMDIDSFKEINDVFGHQVGDQALEQMGNILRNSFRKNDFISRYGGDEFTVIIEVNDRTDLVQAVQRVKDNVDQFNQRGLTPYELRLSIGYDVYNAESGMSMDQFLKHIDHLMYEDKLSKPEKIRISTLDLSSEFHTDSLFPF
ncbi:MAG: GGDEF domain-containing protein [Chitinophagales bacterium]